MNNNHNVLKNRLTGNEMVFPEPIDQEIEIFENSLLITETDTEGAIQYVNRRFCKISGYSKEELIGMSYSLTRHPDMPEGLYVAMEKIVGAKKIWRGYVKGLSKSGKYYWTLTYVQAKLDDKNEIIGRTITRRKAYESSLVEAKKKYEMLQGKEHINDPYFMRAELYHGEGVATQS